MLSATEAAAAAGRTRTVCGTVAGSRRASLSSDRLTFLNFDRPYPDSPFTVVIRPEDRPRFAAPPEQTFFGRRVCATGMIEIHRGRPQIVAREPGQVRLDPPPPSGLPAAAGQ
ncbi:MAG: DNA-binding protein [Alphaproteobacteria bacterium]